MKDIKTFSKDVATKILWDSLEDAEIPYKEGKKTYLDGFPEEKEKKDDNNRLQTNK